MNFVYGRSTIAMDSANDRMRLKDKIVANVAKAVKSIQELHVLSGSRSVKLGNYDWQCHRLCEHLDHTLLHGLRHVTPGYWKIVTEFTHKDSLKQIKRMRNVTTDLGRGRAWLLMALNECLLESYLRCYQQNDKLVEEFYVRDALVRDDDRFNILLTIIAGLENTEFQLECDMPYLDLCVYPPNTREHNVEATVEFDRMSICSMESVHMPTKHLPQTVFEDGNSSSRAGDKDAVSVGSEDFTHGQTASPSPDSGIHSDWNFRQRSITPIDHMTISTTSQDSTNDADGDLEVIHLSKKGKPQRHKKKRRKFVSVSSITEPVEDAADLEPAGQGPMIEIPPIDDIKLTSAIMNSQNNNDIDSLNETTDHNVDGITGVGLPGKRLPGDGKENSYSGKQINASFKTSAGNANNTNTGNEIDNDSSVNRSSDIVICNDGSRIARSNSSNLGIIDASGNGTTVDNQEHVGDDHAKRDRVQSMSAAAGQTGTVGETFTDLINARVSDIVRSGLEIEESENHNEINDEDITDNGGTKGVFQYSKDNYGITNEHRDIYSAETVDGVGDQIKDTQTSAGAPANNSLEQNKQQVVEEPSIYSRMSYSDDNDSDADDTESFSSPLRQSFSRNSQQSRNSEQYNEALHGLSQFSERSTPSRNSVGDSRSSQSTPSITHSGKGFRKSVDTVSPCYESDSPFYGLSSNINTPQYVSANQNRCLSEVSYSSANENDHDNLNSNPANQNRSVSQASSNGMSGIRESPAEFRQEDRNSRLSEASSQSPSQDLEGSGQHQALQAKVEELIIQRKLNQYTHLTFGDDDTAGEDHIDTGDGGDLTRDRSDSLATGEVELDNNTRLYLMLDILSSGGEEDGDESIIKMFCSRQGHTEGKTQTVYVLITSCSVYLLQRPVGKKKFIQLVAVPFTDIDFVSIGFNNQIVNIACKSRRQQYWLTPGEERTTIALVDCLAASMEKCESKPGRLEVDTGNTVQKISLQKYIVSECKCEMEEAEVVCYSLVHWEDPTSDKGSCEWDREGTLYYKSNETTTMLGIQTWRLGHAILKDGMLCLYNDKNDAKPTHFLSMGGGQCVGCKRDFNNDKNNAIKIILQDKSFWSIALETEPEANRWLQSLCQAVSEGLKMNTSKASCVPCCMVLSKFKLLMCHEDVETNFVRTLGSANLFDITAVLTDDLNKTYIVLDVESDGETTDATRWVLYFTTQHECHRFKTALAECWYKHYQVHVPELPLDDFSLQRKCTNMAKHLHEALSLN